MHATPTPVEELKRIGWLYALLQRHQGRDAGDSARLAEQRAALARALESMLVTWIDDPALRLCWRQYLDGGGPAPTLPHFESPPVFRGRSSDGWQLDVRPDPTGRLAAYLDGAAMQPLPWVSGMRLWPPPVTVCVRGQRFREEFELSAPARSAFLLHGSDAWPPSTANVARQLFEQGLVDSALALTDRGRRALQTLAGSGLGPLTHSDGSA